MRDTLLSASLMALAALVGSSADAQEQRSRVTQRSAPAQPAPAAPAAPPSPAPIPAPQPIRTEIVTHDNWTVNCREFADKRRLCSATLQLLQSQSNQVVFAWVIGKNADGKIFNVLQTPTGVILGPGVEIKPARGAVRKAAFVNCESSRCEAAFEMDDGFARDAVASETVDATVYGTNGQGVKFGLPFKGFDKALAALR